MAKKKKGGSMPKNAFLSKEAMTYTAPAPFPLFGKKLQILWGGKDITDCISDYHISAHVDDGATVKVEMDMSKFFPPAKPMEPPPQQIAGTLGAYTFEKFQDEHLALYGDEHLALYGDEHPALYPTTSDGELVDKIAKEMIDKEQKEK